MHLFYRTLLTGLLLTGTRSVFAQSSVGIGTTAPNASAVLDLSSSTKGLLVPRLTSAQRTAINAPAVGLLVYQTDGSEGFYFYSAGGWTWLNPLGGADDLGNHTATQALNLQTNPLTGTVDSLLVPGIGVTSNGGLNLGQHDINIRIGFRAGRVALANGVNQFVGYYAGLRTTSGGGNLFEGFMAGRDNTTGSFNVFSGYGSGAFNITGSQNTGVGIGSGSSNTTGGFNVFVGSFGGSSNTTGSNNVFAGYNAGPGNRTGSNNVGLGADAGPIAANLTNAAGIGYRAQVSQSNSLVLGGTGANAVSVGIGTAAPAATLHVAGATSTVRLDGLAGTGTRMLTADATGTLATQAIPVDTDTDAQQLTKSGNTISLTNGGSVTDSDNQLLSRTGATVILTNGGAITLPDASNSNELQTISKTGNIISLSNSGGSVTDTDTDAQTLNVSGGNLSISGGNSVALTSLDAQQLTKSGNTISLTNGGAVTDSDNQSLSISGSTISLTNGGTVTVPSSADNLGNHTATQNLNLGTNTLTGNGGTTGLQISANGRLLTTADNLVAGKNTGNGTLSGINNTVLGSQSGQGLTTGSANTLTGVNAGIALTTASNNTFSGVASGDHTTTGGSNVALGYASGATNVTGSSLTLLGADADVIGTGLTNATAVGRNAKVSQNNSLVLGGTGGSAVNVGIGTTAPGATFEVAGAASTVRFGGLTGAGTRLVNVDASGNLSTQTVASVGDNLGNHTATQNLNLGTNRLVGNGGTAGLSVSNAGFVGIGNPAPAAWLDIQGGADDAGGSDYAMAFSWRGGGYRHWLRTRHNSVPAQRGNAVDFFVNNSATAAGSVNPTTGTLHVLTLENNNSQPRVGIGTTTPATTLEVAGAASTVRLGGLAGTGTRVVTADASGNLGSVTTTSLADNLGNHTATQNLNLGGNRLVGNGGTVGLSISNTGVTSVGGNLNLGANQLVGNGGSSGLYVSNSGNVGIGDGTPAQKLNVNGDAKVAETIFARALAGVEYSEESGPDISANNQDHLVQCNSGWAITNLQVYATSYLNGLMMVNCMRLTGVIDEAGGGTWRSGPGPTADNQRHEAKCAAGEIATGWRITATDFLDGNVGLLCRPLLSGFTRSANFRTANLNSSVSTAGLDNTFHTAACPPGTFLTGIGLWASTRLETILDVYCARISAQ